MAVGLMQCAEFVSRCHMCGQVWRGLASVADDEDSTLIINGCPECLEWLPDQKNPNPRERKP